MRAVTPGYIVRVARFRGAVGPLHRGTYATGGLFETNHLGLSLAVDTGAVQPSDQHAFVFVLGKDQHVRERTDARSDIAELRVGHFRAIGPEVDRSHPPSTSDDMLG